MICVRLLFDAKQKVYSGIAEPSPRMWAGVSSSQQRQKAVVKSNRFLAAFSLHKKSQKHSYPFRSEFDITDMLPTHISVCMQSSIDRVAY